MKNRSVLDCIPHECAIILWVATWILLIPFGIKFPQAISLCGLALMMDDALTGTHNVTFLFEYSLYIGIVIMLLASGLVMLASRTTRTVNRVMIIDAALIGASFLAGVLMVTTLYSH